MRFFPLWLLIPILFIQGCSVPQQPEVPTWVQEPPAATAEEIFGVSVASTPDEAVVSAAGGVAANILQAAEPLASRQTGDNQQRREIIADMKITLQSLDYSQIKVKEQAPLDKDTAVLVTMQRSDVVSQLKQTLTKTSDELSPAAKQATDTPAFVRLGVLGAAHEKQPQFLAKILLLETVDPSTDTSAYRNLSKQIENDYDAIAFGMAVNIISDAGGIVYVETFKQAFRSEGIVSDGKPSGTILLYTDSQQEHTGNSYSVRIRLRIESTADSHKIVQNELYLDGRSSRSYDEARQKTADVLMKKIRDEGLFETLGF